MDDGLTCENCPIGGQEAILERLLVVLFLECIGLCNELVQVLARKICDFISTVPIIYPKKAQSIFGFRWFEFLTYFLSLQIENSGVGILHADAPALHGRDAEGDAVILARIGDLEHQKY